MGVDSVQEYMALEEKDAIIRDFLDRHDLDTRDWYSLIERGYLRAAVMLDLEDPVFPRYAYWLMRHELYYNHRKESGMSEKNKYPSFAWSPKRQKLLIEMYQDGASVTEIATHFGAEEAVVQRGIEKYCTTCTKVLALKKAPAGEGDPYSPWPKPYAQSVLNPDADDLKRLRHLAGYANSLQKDAVRLFLDDRCHEAFYALGKQELLLNEANGIISSMFSKLEP